MILASINKPDFEYDIHSLIQAFYPGREVLVRIFSPEELAEKAAQTELLVEITYGEKEIAFRLLVQGEEVRSGTASVDFSDRTETKNRLKQTLYRLLSAQTQRTLPWGSLTGIRPVKIPTDMMERGCSDEEIRAYLRGTCLATEEKIDLSLEIAKRERSVLDTIAYEDAYSVYVGIPFCPSTCLYCSFPSFSIKRWRERVEDYLAALGREIEAAARLMGGRPVSTVYLGGGTPTSLSPGQMDRLLTQIAENFPISGPDGGISYDIGLLEFTVEAGRPDSITPEKLQVLRDHHVSRISINPQTMKEETLRLIGRSHTVEQTKQAFALARQMGFDNINMDLIVGLPEETIEDVGRTMDEVAALGPESVTVHSLAVKRAARLATEREQYAHLHIENTWEIIRLTQRRCRDMGLFPYYLYRQKNTAGNFENVGFAAPGREGIYNILIMEEKQSILALGAGATSKAVFDHGRRIERVGNVKDVGQYMDRVDEMIERKKKFLEKYPG